MRVTGWTEWDDPNYKEMFPVGEAPDWNKKEEVSKIVADEIRRCGYKFTGSYHQEGDYGVPIIDDTWLYQCFCREWGGIIADAYPDEIDNSDGYGYVKWAWIVPENEEQVVPNMEK